MSRTSGAWGVPEIDRQTIMETTGGPPAEGRAELVALAARLGLPSLEDVTGVVPFTVMRGS